jgi:molybdopterin-guanine dinucleotide biosynthesis protein A
MDASPDLSAFILAGGKSTRMGRDKAFVEFEGSTLLARTLGLARSVTSDVWVVGSREKFAAFGPVVEDVFSGCGPLAGIHAALQSSRRELNLMLAVDTPFISSECLQYLVSKARTFPEAHVVVPRADGRPQPLCAIYRREFLPVVEKALQSGRNKIGALFDTVKTVVIDEEELEAAGFSPSTFRNLNTQDELEAVKLNCGQVDQRSSNLLS